MPLLPRRSGLPVRPGSSTSLGSVLVVAALAVAAPSRAEQDLSPADAGANHQFGGNLDVSGDVAVIGAIFAGVTGQAYVYRFDGSHWIEEDVLAPSDGAPGDRFGTNVAIRGDVAVVTGSATNTSIDPVYVFRFDGSQWNEEQKLFASDGMPGDYFGEDVAVADDQILVGAYGVDDPVNLSGAVYVFDWDGSTWTEIDKIAAPVGSTFFGLDISVDDASGTRMLVGRSNPGVSAYSYVRSGASWALEDGFSGFDGYEIANRLALEGDVAVFNAVDPGGVFGACVFRDDGGWQPEQCFVPPDGSVGDGLGDSGVGVAGDRILLGWDDADQALVYERYATGTWELTRRTEPPIGQLDDSNYGVAIGITGTRALVGSSVDDTAGSAAGRVWGVDLAYAGELVLPVTSYAGAFLGSSLACDGTRILSGERDNDEAAGGAGSAVVFAEGPNGFEEEQRLFASDAQEDDSFGIAVAIWQDLALVGAYLEDTGASNAGAAYAYRFSAGSWGDEQKLQLPAPAAGDWFGYAVALHRDTAAVAARLADGGATNAGSVSVYRDVAGALVPEQTLTADDPVTNAELGASLDLEGELLVAGAPGPNGSPDPGAAYVFRREGSTWSQDVKLEPADGAPGDAFGSSVAVSAGVVAVGAPFHDAAANAAGAVYVYRRTPSGWEPLPKLTASDAQALDNFGFSVAIDRSDILVGMWRTPSFPEADPGSPVLRFRWNGAAYVEVERYESPDGTNRSFGDGFGWDVDIQGDDVCIAATNDNLRGNASGTLYRFLRLQGLVPATPGAGRLAIALALLLTGGGLLSRRRNAGRGPRLR